MDSRAFCCLHIVNGVHILYIKKKRSVRFFNNLDLAICNQDANENDDGNKGIASTRNDSSSGGTTAAKTTVNLFAYCCI